MPPVVELDVEMRERVGRAGSNHRPSSRTTMPVYARWTMSTVPAIALRWIPLARRPALDVRDIALEGGRHVLP